MPRAIRVLAAGGHDGHHDGRAIADTVILDHEQRRAQRCAVTGVKGTKIDIDLAEPARLRTEDFLVLDDGALVEVVAAPEPLIEARASDVSALARLAWQLGDRHISVELLPNRIRMRRDPSVETLLKSLGAKVMDIEAPFEPEGGAYAAGHSNGHDHAHSHDHHHHKSEHR